MAKLSEEDKRIMAEIKAELAEKKKSKGGAKDLVKELADAKKARKVPKFNSKGQSVAKEEAKKPAAKKKKVLKKPEAKKPEAKKPAAKKKVLKKPAAKKTRKTVSKLVKSLKKGSKAGNLKPDAPKTPKQKLLQSLKDSRKSPEKPASTKPEAKKPAAKKPAAKALSAESKPSTNTKIRRKKVLTKSRGGNFRIKRYRVDAQRGSGLDFNPKGKATTATAKPTVKASSTVGPAGDRISPQSKKVPSKLLGRLATVGKGAARFAGPAGLAITAASLLASLIPENTKGGGIGGRKGQAGYTGVDPKKAKDKAKTGAATATSVGNASQTSSESTQGASSGSQSSSFGAAFKKARKSGKSKFSWNGKSYSTATKDEVKKSGSKNLREHLNKLNKKKSK